jgi:hypothetical protein
MASRISYSPGDAALTLGLVSTGHQRRGYKVLCRDLPRTMRPRGRNLSRAPGSRGELTLEEVQ